MAIVLGTDGNDTLVGTADADTLEGLTGDDVLYGGKGADLLDGGAGIDTANYYASTAVAVSLRAHSGFGGDAEGDEYLSIENVSGTAFGDSIGGDDGVNVLRGNGGSDVLEGLGGNDVLLGGDGDDVLIGGLGADLLDGGTGSDTAYYSGAQQAVGVDLGTRVGLVGDADGDRYTSIENVIGSDYADLIRGDAGVNALYGGDGNDSISGGDGNDIIAGESGDDTIAGGAGADELSGGEGIDTLDYSASALAVVVDLAAGTGAGGDAQGDTFTDFEKVIGSSNGDSLFGDAFTIIFSGGDGNDLILGRGGDDVIAGGAGADDLQGGDGVDTLDYSGSAEGVFVNLATGKVSGGEAEGDTIEGFENIVGSALGDQLLGGRGANDLAGGAGNDFLAGGRGRDELTGGTDADRFGFLKTTDSGRTAATRDVIHDFNHAEGDRLVLAIDANAGKPGMQILSFIGTKAFTAPGQVRAFFEGDHTVVEVNTAGNSGAEMQIQLDHHVNLVKGDFIFA